MERGVLGELDPGLLTELPHRAGPMRALLRIRISLAGARNTSRRSLDDGGERLVRFDDAARKDPDARHEPRPRAPPH
jgi:hypothetical protein